MTRVRDTLPRWVREGHDGERTMDTETMQQDPAAEGAQVDVEAGTEQAQAVNDDPAQIEIEQLRGENDQLKDRLARLQAEFDNARKREVKERQDTRDYAVQGAIEPFLSVMDNFQLALKA